MRMPTLYCLDWRNNIWEGIIIIDEVDFVTTRGTFDKVYSLLQRNCIFNGFDTIKLGKRG